MLSCFELKPPRNRIVFEAGLFPSVRYVQQAWTRFGAEVVVCPDADAVIDAIDERTLLVPISHVLYKSAEIQPIERIVERAHACGRPCLSRRLPVGRHRPARRDRARDRVLRRRLGEVAVRRARARAGCTCAPTSPTSSSRRSPAGRDTRGRSHSRRRWIPRRAPRGSSPAPRSWPRTTRRARATRSSREIGVDRIRANSMRQTALLVELVDEAGFELTSPREPDEARRLGRLPRAGLPGRACRARRARHHLRHPSRRGHPLRPALLHHRRRAPLRGRPGAARSSRPARTSQRAHAAAGY